MRLSDKRKTFSKWRCRPRKITTLTKPQCEFDPTEINPTQDVTLQEYERMAAKYEELTAEVKVLTDQVERLTVENELLEENVLELREKQNSRAPFVCLAIPCILEEFARVSLLSVSSCGTTCNGIFVAHKMRSFGLKSETLPLP